MMCIMKSCCLHDKIRPRCATQEDGTVMGPGSDADEEADGSSDDDVAAAVQAMAAKASQQEVSVRTGERPLYVIHVILR